LQLRIDRLKAKIADRQHIQQALEADYDSLSHQLNQLINAVDRNRTKAQRRQLEAEIDQVVAEIVALYQELDGLEVQPMTPTPTMAASDPEPIEVPKVIDEAANVLEVAASLSLPEPEEPGVEVTQRCTFDTVRIDREGNIIAREEKTAPIWLEDFGGEVSLEMMGIEAGSFRMGAPLEEVGSLDQERPQHRVHLKSFLIGRYPITQAQWRVVAGFPKQSLDLNPDPSHFKGDNRPVEKVWWHDAVEFCERLSQATGRAYRLPTEAEWEYSCRAGTTTPFCFGETLTTKVANYRGSFTYGQEPKGKYREETTVVGSFPANGWGLYDMHGNVWEWCLDHSQESYGGKPEICKQDGSVPWTFANASRRPLRGGSWADLPGDCRSAIRDLIHPDDRFNFFGFRVVRLPARILPSPSVEGRR
jgi:formylglycine-generating enzyme required for sulfatase activity